MRRNSGGGVEGRGHVTNGDAAVGPLRAAGLEGDVLPARTLPHEGPVPAGLDHAALRATRTRFPAGPWDVGAREVEHAAAAPDARSMSIPPPPVRPRIDGGEQRRPDAKEPTCSTSSCSTTKRQNR